MEPKRRIYKVVLTGGPCGGKTTGQSRLCTFFENLGWKVYRVPEAANTLLSGGVKFKDLPDYAAFEFQESLLLTMLQIEKTFFKLAEASTTDCLVICDRGSMDPASYISQDKWQEILKRNDLDMVELRDSRYNQIVHMVSAAKGAEEFYTLEDHASRSEGLEEARRLEDMVSKVWIGHPYVDVIDNSTNFENKLARLIKAVCRQCGIDTFDRLSKHAKKRKFLVEPPLPPESCFPPGFQDFIVIHNYLIVNSNKYQARLRKRGQKGSWSYTHTVRRSQHGQTVEVRNQISHREYNYLLNQSSEDHMTIHKLRRCFIHSHQYYQLDLYQEPCHSRCKGLMFLEIYTTLDGDEVMKRLPSFLKIKKEVTGDPLYSMFNLSLKDDSLYVQKFCHRLAEEDDRSGSFDKLHQLPMINGESERKKILPPSPQLPMINGNDKPKEDVSIHITKST